MNTRVAAAFSALLWMGPHAAAHRLDEYLQAALIDVAKDRVRVEMRLAPGVAVFPIVLAAIDTDRDGVISEAEQRAYAAQVLKDLSLGAGGNSLTLRLASVAFPEMEQMKEGRGEIQLEFDAEAPRSSSSRRLVFENRHQSGIAVYQVNALIPRDPAIRIVAQKRDYLQSRYEVDYAQASDSRSRLWFAAATLLLGARLAILLRDRSRAAKTVRVGGLE